jgi:hypothetical protein
MSAYRLADGSLTAQALVWHLSAPKTALTCAHTDDDETLIEYETPIADAGYSAGIYRWACPVGAFHEILADEL